MSSQVSYTPVDMDSIRKKLQQITQKSRKQSLILKLQPGDTTLRIIPYRHAKDPFSILYFHYDIAGIKSLLCPSSVAKSCPICEFANELRQSRTKEDFEAFKKIASKERVYVPVIVRGKEEEGARFWGTNKSVYEALLSLYNNPEYGDISHPIEGTDIVVTFTGPSKEIKYGKTTVSAKRNSTPLHQNKDLISKIMKDVPNVMEAFEEKSYDELKKILDNYLNPKEEVNEQTDTLGEVIGPVEENNQEVVVDLDKEFEELLKPKTK